MSSNNNGGSNRDWGYASYDVDKQNDYSDSNLQYTSYEKSGSVNRYGDNGDGGHSHSYYKDSNDYNSGKDPDNHREDSNESQNPSIDEVQNNGGCYLTTACLKHQKESFKDDCDELTILRWFRDQYVTREDIEYYYDIAPVIIDCINEMPNSDLIYDYIYQNVVTVCVDAIKKGDYNFAYERYKNSVYLLEEQYAKPVLGQRLIKTIKTI